MTVRGRLSATVDAELIEAGKQAVAAGRARSLSAWVNEAMRRQTEHDLRLQPLGDFIAEYEREHGVITDAEMSAAARRARNRAVVVRASQPA